ncbi:DNA polymerase theta [Cryptosporidium felis]|nr:DNA polymerase theta [Cryptosporidium felis]
MGQLEKSKFSGQTTKKGSNSSSKDLISVCKFYTYLNNLLIVTPKRRVGIWRKVFDENGDLKKCFISVSGDSILEPECFGVAKRELSMLEEIGVSQRGYNSGFKNISRLKPYSDFRGSDKHSLSYWNIPYSVQYQYNLAYDLTRLKDWQVNALLYLFESGSRNDFSSESLERISPQLIISPNVAENQTLCEILALNELIFRGGNVLAIFPNPQKCDSYYQRCKTLFGAKSLNLRIEVFGQNSRQVQNSWFPNIDITICTLEKANSLINRLIRDNMLIHCIKTIIIDDINFLENFEKGHILEGILTKISCINLVGSSASTQENGKLVCLYVSNGIISQIELYKKVLGTSLVVQNCDGFRVPDPKVYIKRANHLYLWEKNKPCSELQISTGDKYAVSRVLDIGENHSNSNQQALGDFKYFSDIILETLLNNKKALVVCPTIEWCRKSQQTVIQILSEIYFSGTETDSFSSESCFKRKVKDFICRVGSERSNRLAIVEELKNAAKRGLQREVDSLLLDGILNFAISVHNSKLSFKERRIIEDGFKSGQIKVLFSTSLFMMDSEIKADRIVLRSIGVGRINTSSKNTTGNREWISRSSLEQLLNRVYFPKADVTAKTCTFVDEMHAEKEKMVHEVFEGGVYIITGSDLELAHLNTLLNCRDETEGSLLGSRLTDLNLSRFLMELVVLDLVDEFSILELILSRFTFRGALENESLFSESALMNLEGQREQKGQKADLGIDILLSISYLIMNQLVYVELNERSDVAGEFSISGTYMGIRDKFGCLKSPIVSSKFALLGPKTRDRLNRPVLGIILKQNDFLAKLESGKKYLSVYSSGITGRIRQGGLIGTCLGGALLNSQIHPCFALEIYSELVKAKYLGIDFSDGLEIYILGTLGYYNSAVKVNWKSYLQVFGDLTKDELAIADMYGIDYKVISEIVKTEVFDSNLIPNLVKLSPVNIHFSYFYSESLSFKGLVEKYRLISIYRFYYACLFRDLCNPMITFDIILTRYSIQPSMIQQVINSFNSSIVTVSNISRLIGWFELSDIILNLKNHLSSCISIRNVKYMHKISCKQGFERYFQTNSDSESKMNDGEQLDQQEITKIMSFVNSIRDLTSHITPNVAISMYFSGLNCIERIASASLEAVQRSLQFAAELDGFGIVSQKSPDPQPLNVLLIAQEIIESARKSFSQSEDSQDNNSLSCSDILPDPESALELDMNLSLELENMEFEANRSKSGIYCSNLTLNSKILPNSPLHAKP